MRRIFDPCSPLLSIYPTPPPPPLSGPVGMVEVKPFHTGTYGLVDRVASLTSPEVVTVVCGG